MTSNTKTAENIREGLILCMLLTMSLDGDDSRSESLREITHITLEEPEFSNGAAASLEKALTRAEKDLHKNPEAILKTIARLLEDDDSRRRGVELATRIVTADGIVRPEHVSLLSQLVQALDLPPEVLEECVLTSQRRLVRFMMVYLVYLTATSDGKMHAEEFEEMLPLVLSLPAFKGVSTEGFRFMTGSVRRHLEQMGGEWGLDYITGTLLKASELLRDESIPEQALKIVARGIFADGVIRDDEQEFFFKVARKLGLAETVAPQMLAGVAGSQGEKQ